MVLYVDTSALVKRYIAETGSEETVALINKASVIGAVVVTQVEMAAALAKATRLGWVERSEAQLAWQDFLGHWPAFVRLSVTSAVLALASHLVWQYGLRGCDALHLAAASSWQDALGETVTLATFNHELWESARKAGMAVWPENPKAFRP